LLRRQFHLCWYNWIIHRGLHRRFDWGLDWSLDWGFDKGLDWRFHRGFGRGFHWGLHRGWRFLDGNLDGNLDGRIHWRKHRGSWFPYWWINGSGRRANDWCCFFVKHLNDGIGWGCIHWSRDDCTPCRNNLLKRWCGGNLLERQWRRRDGRYHHCRRCCRLPSHRGPRRLVVLSAVPAKNRGRCLCRGSGCHRHLRWFVDEFDVADQLFGGGAF
jgi:hypothetical protein